MENEILNLLLDAHRLLVEAHNKLIDECKANNIYSDETFEDSLNEDFKDENIKNSEDETKI